MRRALFALCVVAISAVACSSDKQPPSAIDTTGGVVLCEPTVTPASANIAVGDSVRFAATFCGNPGIRWKSSDTTKAVVGQTGVARGIGAGVSTIIAMSLADTTVKGAGSLTIHSP